MTDITDDWDPYDERDQDLDDDWYNDDPYEPDEPDEPDWGYEEWRAKYEDHCIQAHGGADCDCRRPLRGRLNDAFRRARRLLHRPRWYTDEPPF